MPLYGHYIAEYETLKGTPLGIVVILSQCGGEVLRASNFRIVKSWDRYGFIPSIFITAARHIYMRN